MLKACKTAAIRVLWFFVQQRVENVSTTGRRTQICDIPGIDRCWKMTNRVRRTTDLQAQCRGVLRLPRMGLPAFICARTAHARIYRGLRLRV